MNLPPALQIGGRVGDSTYSVSVQSPSTEELYESARQLKSAMEHVREIQDVSSDLQLKSPQVMLAIDRDKAAALGLDATRLQNVLSSGYGQKWSSTIYGDTAQYKVLLEVDPRYQAYADSLQRLTFRAAGGGMVPLPVGADDARDRRPAERESLGAASRRRDLVRPASGCVAGGCGGCHPRSGAADGARDGDAGLRGLREGLSGGAREI